MDQSTAAASPTKLGLGFSSGDTFDTEMNEIRRTRIPSRELINLQFPPSFCCDCAFISSDGSSA